MTRSGTLLQGSTAYAKATRKGIPVSVQMKNKAGRQIPEAIVVMSDKSGSLRKSLHQSQERAKKGFSRYSSFHAHLI